MATETPSVAPPRAEVPMVDAEVVRQIRELHRGGWGAKRIARELEVARNTVRRYLRLRTVEAGIQIRPRARQLDAPDRKSTRLNSSHRCISYAVFCLKKTKPQKG